MPDWLPPILGTLDIAAFAALIIGVFWNARETRRGTYIQLETEALELFRFEAEYRAVMSRLQNDDPDSPAELSPDDTVVANNYFLQTLNLFEIAVRLRRRRNLEKTIFGTWVAWFLEASEYPYFRQQWAEYRLHYSPDMRGIFDDYFARVPDLSGDYETRQRIFYEVAGKRMKCRTISRWLDEH